VAAPGIFDDADSGVKGQTARRFRQAARLGPDAAISCRFLVFVG
jgi:hypothetical protein